MLILTLIEIDTRVPIVVDFVPLAGWEMVTAALELPPTHVIVRKFVIHWQSVSTFPKLRSVPVPEECMDMVLERMDVSSRK